MEHSEHSEHRRVVGPRTLLGRGFFMDIEHAAVLGGFPLQEALAAVEWAIARGTLRWAPDGSDCLILLPFDRGGNVVH